MTEKAVRHEKRVAEKQVDSTSYLLDEIVGKEPRHILCSGSTNHERAKTCHEPTTTNHERTAWRQISAIDQDFYPMEIRNLSRYALPAPNDRQEY